MFNITEEQREKIKAWAVEIDVKVAEKQKAEGIDVPEELLPYYGAIGGSLTYMFTPTSIGVVVKVKHGYTGEELDITEYDLW